MIHGKKQDPNAGGPPGAEWWTVDEAVRCLARVAGHDLAIYLLTEAASRGRLPVTCRRSVVDANGKPVLAEEGIVRPDFWRGHLTFAFVNRRAQVRPLKALEPGEYEYLLPARIVRGLLPASSAASKPSEQTPTASKPSGQTGSKAGSAAAWIDEQYPSGEWRLLTAMDIYKNIERVAKDRKINKWPSLSSVERELRKRRQAK